MVALMVNSAVGISAAASVMVAGILGVLVASRKPEPHDPEREYQKLVARLRR